MHTVDTSFASLVRGAAAGHKRSIVQLAKIVRSGEGVGVGECAMLADMMLGRIAPDHVRGRPPRPTIRPIEQRRATAEYLERTDAGEHGEAVANEIYNRLGIGRSTFHLWLSECSETVTQLELQGKIRKEAIGILRSS
jgi:hypothetical protein